MAFCQKSAGVNQLRSQLTSSGELGSDSLLSHLFLALIAAPIDATLFPRPAAV